MTNDINNTLKKRKLAIKKAKDKVKFAAFIKLLKSKKKWPNWHVVATAMGVSERTIRNWNKLPEARKARAKGIDYALEKMEESGGGDWRMWEALAKIRGAREITRHEISGLKGQPIKHAVEFVIFDPIKKKALPEFDADTDIQETE